MNDLAKPRVVVSFSTSNRDQQRRDIMQMRRWLAEWFDEASPADPRMHQEPRVRGPGR